MTIAEATKVVTATRALETQINAHERTIEAQRQAIAALSREVEAYRKCLDILQSVSTS